MACFVSDKSMHFGREFLNTLKEASIPYLVREVKEEIHISQNDFSVGAKIQHPKWGEGLIEDISGEKENEILTIINSINEFKNG